MAHQDRHRVRERAVRRFFRQFAQTYDALWDGDRDIVWEAGRYAEKVVQRTLSEKVVRGVFPCAD